MAATDANALILVVEDDPETARLLEVSLQAAGYTVQRAATLVEATARVQAERPALILLGLVLPDGLGLEFLARLRAQPAHRDVSAIVVSACGDESTVVQALHQGADDCVTKPLRMRELVARVSTALRHRGRLVEAIEVLQCGSICLAPATRAVWVAGQPVELTRTEFDLLAFFLRHPGRALTREELCEDALGSGGAIMARTIDAHLRTIRRKLGAAGQNLTTVRGVGYRLVPTP